LLFTFAKKKPNSRKSHMIKLIKRRTGVKFAIS